MHVTITRESPFIISLLTLKTSRAYRKKDDPEFRAKNAARSREYVAIALVASLSLIRELGIARGRRRPRSSPRKGKR